MNTHFILNKHKTIFIKSYFSTINISVIGLHMTCQVNYYAIAITDIMKYPSV